MIERRMDREEQLRTLIKKLELPIQNLNLIDCALTHTSFANESKNPTIHDNERLEFLGDAVLDLIVGEYLFLHHPQMNEGTLTRSKASVVCEKTLAECSQKLNFGDYLRLGKGEINAGANDRPSILADTFEAVVGAIYLDTNYEETEKFVLKQLKTPLEYAERGQYYTGEYKTLLQEYVQSESNQKLEYRLVFTAGPDHDRTFGVEVVINDTVYGSGVGKSKKVAEKRAAEQAYKLLVEKEQS